MINFKQIDIIKATKEEWKEIHSIRKQISKEEEPEEPVIEDTAYEFLRKGYLINFHLKNWHYNIYEDNTLIGSFSFNFFSKDSPSYKGNENILHYNIQLLKQCRRKGIATKALQILAEHAKQEEKTTFICETSYSGAKEFFEHIGAKIVQIHADSKLILAKVNKKKLKDWITEAEKLNSDTKLVIVENNIPDEYITGFTKTYTDTGNDQPSDELETGGEVYTVDQMRKDEANNNLAGIKVFSAMTVEKIGEISAMSQLKMFPGREKVLSQSLTGVLRKYRGRKLGKWVKAKTLLYIMENYPQTEAIITGNAESNGPMLHINNSLGFTKYKQELTAQITLEELIKYLNEKNTSFPQIIN